MKDLEAAFMAPLKPWTAYGDAAERPAPSFAASAAVLMIFAASFFGLNLLHAAISSPAAVSGYPADRFALAAGAGMLLALFGSFGAAAAFHVVALLCGGTGSFRRSYQALALAGILLPLQALVLWAPGPMLLMPPFFAAMMAAAALERLHGVKPLAARAACAVSAALMLAGAWTAARQLDAALRPYAQMIQALQAGAAAPTPFPIGTGLEAPPAAAPPDPAQAMAAIQSLMEAMPAISTAAGAPVAAGSSSGLDLVAAPSADGAPAAGTLPPQLLEMQRQAASKMADNTALLDAQAKAAKTPEERRQIEQMAALMRSVSGMMGGGKPPSAAEAKAIQEQLMQSLQSVTQELKKQQGAQQDRRRAAPAPEGGAQ